jgi:hypothetical protein
MADQEFRIKSYYDRTISIDDDAQGGVARLPIRIRRFTLDQLQAFSAGLKRCENRAADRYLSRKPDEDEQARVPLSHQGTVIQVYAVPDVEIRRRRLLEMSDAERTAFEQADAEDERVIAAFYASVITDYVSVQPGVRLLFEDAAGQTRPLATGADLVAGLAGNASALAALVRAVREENTLSPEEKKRLRSSPDLMRSSTGPDRTANGGGPGATVAPVNGKDSAASAPASDLTGPIPSGSTVM